MLRDMVNLEYVDDLHVFCNSPLYLSIQVTKHDSVWVVLACSTDRRIDILKKTLEID